MESHALRGIHLSRIAVQIASAGSLPDVLRAAVQSSRSLVEADFGVIHFIDRVVGSIDATYQDGYPVERIPEGVVPEGLGVLGRVMRGGTVFTEDVTTEEDFAGFPEWHPEVRAMIGVPVKHGDAIHAIMIAGKGPGSGTFRDDDLFFVSALAGLAGVAVHAAVQRETLEQARRDAESLVHARSDLLVEMSGRLREHVNTVLGMGEVMLSTPLSPDQRGYVSSVMRNADAILDHLESTLERQKVYTTVLDLESIEFAPRSTLDEVLRRAHRKARTTDVTVKSAIGDDLPALLSGDPGRLRQVLDALLDNAIGYTDEGEVGLAAGMHGEDDDHVALWFEVSDTGLGIPADRVLKVFESGSLSTPGGDRLVRLPSHSLWNVRRLVEAMGGEITVQSEPGRGSAFRFTARFGTVQDEASLQPAIVDAVNDLRVLVAQQQQDDCLILTRMFDDMGARVRCVPSGSEAVEAVISAARAASPFDLVLLDANLDPTSGFEATRILRSLPEGRGLPVILISPSGRRGESRRCREAGCDGYLTKPVRRAELYDSVMLVLGRRITGREGLVTRHSIRESSAPRERVLIVGDDSPNAFAAARLLEGRGLETTIVTDVDAAVDTLARDGSYDLALVNLSGGAGQLSDAPGRLRGSSGVYARLPVLVIVDRGALDDRQSSIDDGASDYVSSPVDEAELVATVQRWSRKSTPSATVSGIPRAAPPALDPAPVLDRIAGDAALYAELAGMATTQIPERISTVRRAVHAGDEEGTAAALGSLLEVATTVGAAQMAAVARELSRTPDGGALDDAALRNLDMAWERLRPGLEEAAS